MEGINIGYFWDSNAMVPWETEIFLNGINPSIYMDWRGPLYAMFFPLNVTVCPSPVLVRGGKIDA